MHKCIWGMVAYLQKTRQWVISILGIDDYLRFRVYIQNYFLLLYLEYVNKWHEDCIPPVCLRSLVLGYVWKGV